MGQCEELGGDAVTTKASVNPREVELGMAHLSEWGSGKPDLVSVHPSVTRHRLPLEKRDLD